MRWERTITVIGCHIVGGEDNHVIVGVMPSRWSRRRRGIWLLPDLAPGRTVL